MMVVEILMEAILEISRGCGPVSEYGVMPIMSFSILNQ